MNLKIKTSRKKRLFCIVLALVCAFSAMIMPHASAEKTLEELNAEYEQIEKEIQENQEKLEEVQDDIKTNEDKLNKLNGQIDKINDQIDLLDESIDILNSDIDSLQGDIDATTDDIEAIALRREEILLQMAETRALMDETEEMLLARLRENYMSGGGSTVELLLTSGDMATYFARKELVTRVSEDDAKLISELTDKINELNALEKELEVKMVELEEKEAVLNTQMTDLTDKQTDLESSMEVQQDKKKDATKKQNEVKYLLEDLDKDSDAYKAAIKRKEAERAALEAEIEAAIKSDGSSTDDTPDEQYNNDGNMLWPVPGATKLTATYPSYSDGSPHWGIDIVRTDVTTKGSPFRAAQGGKVILALNDGNWNYGFGNYCIIDHGDGKHTLYAHSQRLYVKEGDIVQKGDEIGLIGDTGNTTGPHLHFEVRIQDANGNVSRVNPLNYVSKP